MRRLLLPLVAVVAFVHSTPAQKPEPKKPPREPSPLAEAEKLLLKGSYEEARAEFAERSKGDDKLKPAAAVGVAESHRLAGEYAKATEVLDAAAKDHPKSADVLAARAELLYELGRWDDADKDADAAIAAAATAARPRWVKACLLRDRGLLPDAKEAFRWCVRAYNPNKDYPAAELTYLSLGVAEYYRVAATASSASNFKYVLNTMLADALKADPDYWPAEQAAGQLLLEKYNRPDALDAFDKVLKTNPKAADPLVGKALAAVVKFDLKDADALADQALKLNPKHTGALRVKADVLLGAGDLSAAKKLLDAARGVNGKDVTTLGRLAAVALLANDANGFEVIEKEVAGFDAKPGVFYHEVAVVLDDRKQLTRAEGYYRKAMELRPGLAAPRTGLGMLLLRLGHEDEGKKLLDEAFKADPFNVRVSNSRKVLTHLGGYARIETDHYTLKYDPKTDAVLAEWMAEYLEEVHADLKKQYGFEPKGKVLIEVFSTHEMFSGRMVGLPDLHTVGACIGRVVAVASPKAKGLAKPYNWGRVLRHELTHVFNLAQTDFQCPHWITEGLAVQNEKMARPPAWTAALKNRFAQGDLLTLDTITLAFVRPKNPEEWTLAYTQSQLYVEYLAKTHGQEAVAKVMTEYLAGKDTAAAIKAACGVEKAEFEKGYRRYVTDLVQGLGGGSAAEKPMTFDELKAASAKAPDDLDLKAKLAEQLLRRNMTADAKKLADAVLDKEPAHPVASVVRAKLLLRAGDDDGAKEALDAAVKAKPDDVRLLAAVGRLHLERKEYAKAAEVFEKGKKASPNDADWNEQLARIYKETKDEAKLAAVLAEQVAHDPDDLDARVRLAKTNLDTGNHAAAEGFARDALMIDVNNADAKDSLLDALRKQKKDAEADKIEKRYAK